MTEDFALFLQAEMAKQKLNASPTAVAFAKVLTDYHARQETHVRDLQQTANQAYLKGIELEGRLAAAERYIEAIKCRV